MLILIAALPLSTGTARGDTPTRIEGAPERAADDHLGINLLGALGFMRLNVAHWSLGYERVLSGGHAVLAMLSGVHVHDPESGDALHVTTFGAHLGYRHHFRRGDSPFVGIVAGYRIGSGRREAIERSDFDVRQWSVLPQIGHRWHVPGLRLSITASAGVGYGPYRVTPDQPGEMAEQSADVAETALGATPLSTEFELSLAFAF